MGIEKSAKELADQAKARAEAFGEKKHRIGGWWLVGGVAVIAVLLAVVLL
jgi:uncharacterized membrane protein